MSVTDADRPPTPFNVTVRPLRNSLHIAWSVASSARPADYHVVEYRTVGQWVPLTDRLPAGLNSYNWTTASDVRIPVLGRIVCQADGKCLAYTRLFISSNGTSTESFLLVCKRT